MHLQELADKVLKGIQSGDLDPNAKVVRPLCSCDEEVGYVEVQHIDQVRRVAENAPGVHPGQRIYRYGNVQPSNTTEPTIRLG